MKNIRHIGIYVQDLEKEKDFYCQNFGMKVLIHAREEGKYIETVLGKKGIVLELYKLEAEDGNLLELLYVENSLEKQGREQLIYMPGVAHIAFTVSDVQKVYEDLSGNGIYFISEPVFPGVGKRRFALPEIRKEII